jgi:hypothetical protein
VRSRVAWGAGLEPGVGSLAVEQWFSRVALGLAVGALLVLSGCRSRGLPGSTGTRIGPGQTIYGRLPEGRATQSFTLQGVESSLLSFSVDSDRRDFASPAVALLDPAGQPLDLAPFVVTPEGAASYAVQGVVLLQTGTYLVTVKPQSEDKSGYYTFRYNLGFPPIEGMRTTLKADEPIRIGISAPEGGLVSIRIAPFAGSGVRPDIRGVKDPWGGLALDPARRPERTPPAQVSHGQDGSMYLSFPAPIAGKYVVLAAAEAGHEGAAVIDASVRPRGPTGGVVHHPNTAPGDYGVPSATSGSASDTGPR